MIAIYQASKLKMQYLQELENYIECFVLISALVTMIFKETILHESKEAAIVRGVTAVGICSAWLQLIFIIGRYPFSGGDFSIMFYNIIKKIARYLIIMILMIIGFAFAFMVVNYRHEQESFQNPIKSLMMTFTMALGEFEFVDMYNDFGEDSISRGFAMVLLVILILFGTITMVNLFIAVIISDITQLHADVYTQNLINMAHCSILVEELLPACILRRMKLESKVTICVHNICTKECTGILLPDSLNPVLEELRKLQEIRLGKLRITLFNTFSLSHICFVKFVLLVFYFLNKNAKFIIFSGMFFLKENVVGINEPLLLVMDGSSLAQVSIQDEGWLIIIRKWSKRSSGTALITS